MDLYRRGREAWPTIALSRSRFEAFVSERGAGASLRRAADLYLACGLAARAPGALEAFEAHHMTAVAGLLRARGFRRDEVEDICQALRIRLLVGARPQIETYGGRGSLRRWLLIAALRDAVKLRRRSARLARGSDELLEELGGSVALDVESMKQSYRAAFRSAFARAVAELSPRQRNLLRLHTVERLRLEEIGAVYGAHRATVARWLQRARDQLSRRTRAALAAELETPVSEIDSVLRLIASRLDASVERLLAAPA